MIHQSIFIFETKRGYAQALILPQQNLREQTSNNTNKFLFNSFSGRLSIFSSNRTSSFWHFETLNNYDRNLYGLF